MTLRFASLLALAILSVSPAFANGGMAQYFLKAAQTAGVGSFADKAASAVWFGAFATCTQACTAMLTAGPNATVVCNTGTAAGQSASSAGAAQVSSNAPATATNTASGGQSVSAGASCLSSMTYDAAKAAISLGDSALADSSAKSNTDSAAKLSGSHGALRAQVSGNGSSGDAAHSVSASAGTAPGSDPCSSAAAHPSSQSIMDCAIAKDSTLPSFVKSTDFPQQFEKSMGMTLTDYMSKDLGTLKNALASAAAGALPADKAQTVASLLDSNPNRPQTADAGGSYQSAGSLGGKSDSEPVDLIAGLMKNLMPGKPGQAGAESNGLSAVAFANERSPSAIAEDRKLSLFDRVTYRYSFVGKRVSGLNLLKE